MRNIKIYEIPTVDYVEKIDDPRVGMIFYIADIDMYYSVKALKEINSYNTKGDKVVEYIISDYAEFGSGSGGGSGLTAQQLANIAKIPVIQSTVDGLPNNYAAKAHRHDASEIDNLPSGGNGGSTTIVNDLTTGGTNKALSAEQGKVIKSSLDNMARKVENKAESNHTHTGYASVSHRHDASEIDNLPNSGTIPKYYLDKISKNETGILSLMSFNVWQGKQDYIKLNEFLSTNLINIFGLQEAREGNNLTNTGIYDITNREYYKLPSSQCNVIQSNLPLYNKTTFVLPGSGEQRGLIKCTTYFNGDEISIYNCHLDAQNSNDVRYLQLDAIKKIMDEDTCNNKILFGDFNVRSRTDFDRFKDNYKMAQGFNDIWYDTWDYEDGWGCKNIDNIIISNNMSFVRTYSHTDKMSSDHYCLCADVVLNKTIISDNTNTTTKVENITLKSQTSIIKGSNEVLSAILSPPNATNKKVTWSVNNSNVTIVANELSCTVTGVNVGSSIVTVTTEDGNKTASCNVNVTETNIDVQSISLNKNVSTLSVEKTERLTVTFNPPTATNQTLTWKSNNNNCAVVDGLVTAKAEGECIITATSNNGKTASCTYTITAKVETPNTIITDGLVRWYDFSEYTNADKPVSIVDKSGNNNNASLVGFTFTDNKGFKDGTLIQEGEQTYIKSDSRVLTHTLEFKVRVYLYSVISSVICFPYYDEFMPNSDVKLIDNKNTSLYFYLFSIDELKIWGTHHYNVDYPTSTIFTTTEYYHITVVIKTDTTIDYYCNGIFIKTIVFEQAIPTFELGVCTGFGYNRSITASNQYKFIRQYNRQLTPEEIKQNYDNSL